MSNQTWTSLETQNPQSWSIPSPNPSVVGVGIALLLLGTGVFTHLTRQRQSAPRSTATRQVLQWIGQARSLANAQQYEQAIAVYEQGLREYPNDYRLWQEHGLQLAKLQQFERAIVSYDRATKLCHQPGFLAHERGDALLSLKRYEEALASLTLFLRHAPNSSHILGDIGFAQHQLGRHEEALRSLDRAIKYGQQDRASIQQAYTYQIESFRQLGQLQSALQTAQKASQRYPEEKTFITQKAELQRILAIDLIHEPQKES